MTKEAAQFLVEAMENSGEEAELREKYSGRGMYGQSTCAIVVDHISLLIPAVIELTKQMVEDEVEIPEMPTFRMDNMANRTILY